MRWIVAIWWNSLDTTNSPGISFYWPSVRADSIPFPKDHSKCTALDVCWHHTNNNRYASLTLLAYVLQMHFCAHFLWLKNCCPVNYVQFGVWLEIWLFWANAPQLWSLQNIFSMNVEVRTVFLSYRRCSTCKTNQHLTAVRFVDVCVCIVTLIV